MSDNSWLFHQDIYIAQQVEEKIKWVETSDLVLNSWCAMDSKQFDGKGGVLALWDPSNSSHERQHVRLAQAEAPLLLRELRI